MAGFFLESLVDTQPNDNAVVIDLGHCEQHGTASFTKLRSRWSFWSGSRQWKIRRSATSVLVINGQPDRFPRDDEELSEWLFSGRGGSFRGFEIASAGIDACSRITVFNDPLGSRPVFVMQSAEGISIADKLATLVANARVPLQPNWGGLLETAMLGSLYSRQTSVTGAVLLSPGTVLIIENGRIAQERKTELPIDARADPETMRRHPVASLYSAMRTAVQETWAENDIVLLLSGGLDSRLVLASATRPRRTMSLDLFPHETAIAAKVARECNAEYVQLTRPPDHLHAAMKYGFLLTGAMGESRFITHLGFGKEWRQSGIGGITHGYLHNMLLRGWVGGRFVRYPVRNSILYDLMGSKGFYFATFGCRNLSDPAGVYALLTSGGQQLVRDQLCALAEDLETVLVDEFDLTFERRLLGFLTRQVYYPVFLGWIEEMDVASPILHPILWNWNRFTHPSQRESDKAVKDVLLTRYPQLASIADSNSGQPVSHSSRTWKEKVSNQPWFPVVRGIAHRLRKPPLQRSTGLNFSREFRSPDVVQALRDALNNLTGSSFFDFAQVEEAFDRYLAGDDQMAVPLWSIATAGQWNRFLREPDSVLRKVDLSTGSAVTVSVLS